MRLTLALAAWAVLASSASAASVPDWPTKCAILRSAAAWRLPSPYAGGQFSEPPNDVFKALPGMVERLGTPTPNLTDDLPWPNKNCPGKDVRRQDVNLFFGEPLVDLDFAAVDLEQDQGLARNRTRLVLKQAGGQWTVISVLTYDSKRLTPLEIVWTPKAARSSRPPSAPEPPSSPGS